MGGKKLGFLPAFSPAISLATKLEIASFAKNSKYHPREIATRDGTRIELKQKAPSTFLIITRKVQRPKTLWTSDLENCHSLNLSSDEKYVAFICEQNGVIVHSLDRVR